MTGTLTLSGIYQWWAEVEDAPFGSPKVRGLLIARGVGGFFGGMCRLHRRKRQAMANREQCTGSTVSMKPQFPFQIHGLIGSRFTQIPTPVRRYRYHLPGSDRCLLGLFIPSP